MKLFVVYELDLRSRDLNHVFTLKYCLFGAVKLTKTADPENILTQDMVLGLIHVFHFQFSTLEVKMLLLLE